MIEPYKCQARSSRAVGDVPAPLLLEQGEAIRWRAEAYDAPALFLASEVLLAPLGQSLLGLACDTCHAAGAREGLQLGDRGLPWLLGVHGREHGARYHAHGELDGVRGLEDGAWQLRARGPARAQHGPSGAQRTG